MAGDIFGNWASIYVGDVGLAYVMFSENFAGTYVKTDGDYPTSHIIPSTITPTLNPCCWDTSVTVIIGPTGTGAVRPDFSIR